jgi:hypothetical protein
MQSVDFNGLCEPQTLPNVPLWGGYSLRHSMIREVMDQEGQTPLYPSLSSQVQVDFQQTTWRYIPEDSTLHILSRFMIHGQ